MGSEKSIKSEIKKFQDLDEARVSAERKLDELIQLLNDSELDSDSLEQLHTRFNEAVERKSLTRQDLDEFKKLDDSSLSRLEKADDLEKLLSKYQLDSNDAPKIISRDKGSGISLMILSVLLILLGFAMVVMPAPPYFEMFTIFYFSQNDGVTLMDLIALVIVFTGVYLLFNSLNNLKRSN